MKTLTQTKKEKIVGEIGCYDRVVITGTIPTVCYAGGMTNYLYQNSIKIFDYPQFAAPFRDEIRDNAQIIAKKNGIEIEFISKSHIRKEDIIKKILKKRGYHTGLVHIISAMESCSSYQPWHDKNSGKTYLKNTTAKCLHYYFYFIDEYLGLGYIRVPTWLPCRLQIYFNGHNILANELKKANINYSMIDNAFDSIDDFQKAQTLSDEIDITSIHQRLDSLALKYCKIHTNFNQNYHWSVMQVEYATDIIFKKQEDLQSIYEDLTTTAIHTIKPDNIATFLGKKNLHPNYKGEIGNNYNIRIEGSRIKHTMGKNSIKMYDKFSKILRIETTSNDITLFKHYRKVEHRDGTKEDKVAPLKKNIYSLSLLTGLLKASNRRYIEFISLIETKEIGRKKLDRVTQTKRENNRNYKGFNLFNKIDLEIISIILRGEFNISGFQNKNIKERLTDLSSSQISRLLKRLRVHGIIKKIGKSYKYYTTTFGKEVLLMLLKIKELVIIPAFNNISCQKVAEN